MYKNLNFGALGLSAGFEQAVALAAAHGFAGIDLDMAFLGRMAAEKSPQAARDWFAATGLRAGGIGLNLKWRESDSDADFAASLQALDAEAALAASFGCTRVTTWVMPCSNQLAFRAYWDLAVQRLGAAARVLAAYGMRLGLEFIGPATLRSSYKHMFVHSMDGMLGLCAVLGSNTGLLLDCFHAYTAKVTSADLRALSNDDVVYVHLNDAQAGLGPDQQLDQVRDMVCATGVIDIRDFMAARGRLRRSAYGGAVQQGCQGNGAGRSRGVHQPVDRSGAGMNAVGSLGMIEAVVIGLLCAVLFSGAFVGLLLRTRRKRPK